MKNSLKIDHLAVEEGIKVPDPINWKIPRKSITRPETGLIYKKRYILLFRIEYDRRIHRTSELRYKIAIFKGEKNRVPTHVEIRDKNTDAEGGKKVEERARKRKKNPAWRVNAKGLVLPADRLVSIVVFPVGER